ncbi:riboflavin deaminase [Rhizobiales bacterium RZME27]|uniref:Riboflavin deaminase n=1 Tax=Endobacterium cereale TaxID=2663029 RepID=A0A6A8AIK5_9HYPH|nr:RibD family protein [Endobacterium cereale]MEB2847217.1 RibD family protein [Endobacterium cereale]MQY49066.1 riboflavin deaminase [Endobacterium cereale]
MIDAREISDSTWKSILALRDGEAPDDDAFSDPVAAPYRAVARRNGHPFVIAQIGQSLDGRVATLSGDARNLSGDGGFLHLHRLRALVDAVVVGVGSVVADDPMLTVRKVAGRNPIRVVIDPNGRMPDNCKLVHRKDQSCASTIVVQANDQKPRDDVDTIQLARNAAGSLDAADIVSALQARGMLNILVEGGGRTIEHFLTSEVVDRLHICVAPILIGSGLPGLRLPAINLLSEAIRPRVTAYDLGSDLLFDCEFVGRRTAGSDDGAASLQHL